MPNRIARRSIYPAAPLTLARLDALERRRKEALQHAAAAEGQAPAAGKNALAAQIRELVRELHPR
ncbi:MAG: hypothetical protein JWL71_4179 [Acidobacteria bacterium]|nr:hypothetical protein [Acidobacteriota bacterium]